MTHTTTDVEGNAADDATAGETTVDQAVAAFERGTPVLIHDAADREGETDIVYPAGAVDADAIAHLRQDAGGLICTAVSDAVATAVGLPFLEDHLDHPAAADHDLTYDDRSSFSLPVNYRETFTGITDADRALTVSRLAEMASTVTGATDYGAEEFAAAFRTPGHVHLLRGAPELLSDRRGHTELGLALAAAAGLPPAVVVCEMLDADSGGALTPAAAREYARQNGYVYVEGVAIVDRLG